MIKLYNSYTNTKENLVVSNNKVSLYVCGSTVYNYIHIGNARPIITFDTLRRTLEFVGVEVEHTSNFTDIDDKIIEQAKKEKSTEKEIANRYIKYFNEDIKKLNILKPHHQPLVTKTLKDIIIIIQKLVEDDYAYVQKVTGDVYFNILKSEKYGKLNNINIEKLIHNASNRINEKHSEGANFVLWKITDKGINFDSPWGKGRPGWHTECVAMINNIYGSQGIDIHGGGIDLKFPHHINEIAHSEAVYKNSLAKIWVHNGFVNIASEKMSKSLGNVVLLKDALNRWGMKTLKLLFLSTHYQKPIKYSESELEQLIKISEKINSVSEKISIIRNLTPLKSGEFIDKVVAELSDNLNTSNALTSLYAAIKKFNKLDREKSNDKNKVAGEILSILNILGLR